MANPNMANATSIIGNTTLTALTTATSNVVTNAAASNSVYKLNMVQLANYTTSNVYCNVIINRSSTSFYELGNVAVPAQSTMVVIGRDTLLYLIEGDVLQANVSANSAVTMTTSFEVIS